MEKVNYDVDYFIDKFEKIPSRKIIEGQFESKIGKCANGHCGVTENNMSALTEEAAALNDLFERSGIVNKYYFSPWGFVAYVNDGDHRKYGQPTPKKRILAALHDIKKMISEPNLERSVATEVQSELQKLETKRKKITSSDLPEIVEERVDVIKINQEA